MHALRPLGRLAACLALAGAGYGVGAWSFANDVWPIRALRDFKRTALHQAGLPSQTDAIGRLVQYTGKTDIACPAQDARTAVILFIGQSIQSNTAGQRAASAHGERVAAWFDGRCSVAQSPLLGSNETRGEAMTPTGNRLVASGAFSRVVLAPSAIGDSSIARWGEGGDLNRMLAGVLERLSAQYRITHIVWHQGENDFAYGMPRETYAQHFGALERTLRARTRAPIYVSIATRCDDDSKWRPDNQIAQAQRALPDASRNIFAGVDTDALLDPADRYDGCHLGASGVDKYADALARLLTP